MSEGSKTEVQARFEHILAGIRQPARLIGEEWGSGPGFAGSTDQLRVALGFPDTYEIGISNQALQVLYHVARSVEGVIVERTYLPWVDALAAMRRERVPLLTLETWTPVAAADVLGLTLQHEFDYTNVLEMLDLAGIPLRASERTGDHPLVLAGGPACANFLPMARFFDAVAVGDGELIFPEILEALVEVKREPVSREQVKRHLSEIEGVYVPGISRVATRRVLPHLSGASYPESCLVPLTAGVHDRAWVEIMRGCTRGCRFCQAGMWYRPVRERLPAEILGMTEAQLRLSGHQELAYASLSTTDYSCLGEILEKTAADHPEVRVSLPSLRVDSAAVRLAHLVSPTGPSLTLAPEAGSERMWRIINKNVTHDDVMAAAQEAFRSGRTTLKLYFMVGLPLEEDADVFAMADLCLQIRETGRSILGARAGRLQLNVSVNNFIPKPFTPFQWSGMADRQTLFRRQELLRSRLRRPGIRLALHGVDKSYLEAALARGGEEMGAAVEAAWTRGARFDSWTEEFRPDAWREALAEAGTSAEELATKTLPRDPALPWEVISGVVDRDFLWGEWEKATRGETTADCRWEGCADCGACAEGLATDLAAPTCEPGAVALRLAIADGGQSVAGQGDAVPDTPAVSPTVPARRRWRYLATFAVTGRGRFIGHLDRTEILRRAVRRAGGRLALSAGMRPKPLLSLALPLAVGVEGLRELCEFELQEEAALDFAARLAASLPKHITMLALEPYAVARSVPSRVVGAVYEVRVHAEASDQGEQDLIRIINDSARRFGEAKELPIDETREGRVRRVDVRAYVDRVTVEPQERTAALVEPGQTTGLGVRSVLSFRAKVTPTGTARPEKVAAALGALAGVGLEIEGITRMELLLS